MPSTDVIGYVYDAANYCVACTQRRFEGVEGSSYDEHGVPVDAVGDEGNVIGAIFRDTETDYDVVCDVCLDEIPTRVLRHD